MTANFTRRRDLFLDAGFADPEVALRQLTDDARRLGLVGDDPKSRLSIEESMERAHERVGTLLPPTVQRLVDSAAEWLFERGGDLATFIWLAHTLYAEAEEDLHLGAAVFGLASRLWRQGRRKEAAALLRFLIAVDFDYGDLYTEPGIAYGFFQSRDPNPLVWKLLKYVEHRAHNLALDREAARLNVLELGCGIGNDALGFVSSERTASYIGVDISRVALEEHRKRVSSVVQERPELSHDLVKGDFVSMLRQGDGLLDDVNLIYSYSSLHYFSSGEVSDILNLVHDALEPGRGLFSFAIKGKGSIWDGQGVPLYRPDVWINHDGQSRWFPSRSSLNALADRHGFEVLLHEWYEHWGYSEHGERDLFHYVILTPRT